MTESIIIKYPSIQFKFNPNILSTPTLLFNIEKLKKIADWLLKTINRNEFRKHPNMIKLLNIKYQQFMDLYERAKIEERNSQEKKYIKAHNLFYRPRFTNRNKQYLFDRLEDRRRISFRDRKYR